MKKVGGHFIADGSAININIGFVPDYFRAVTKFEETNQLTYEWWKEQANTGNSNGQFGISRPANGGAVVKQADAANGFASYDQATNQIKLPAPNGEGELAAAVPTEFLAGAAQPTARSTTVLGSTVRPSTGKLTGYIYECTVSAGVLGTEPTTWPSVPGEIVSDGTNTWITREEKVFQGIAKGITVGATISTDSDEWSWEAELWDKVTPELDAQTNDPV